MSFKVERRGTQVATTNITLKIEVVNIGKIERWVKLQCFDLSDDKCKDLGQHKVYLGDTLTLDKPISGFLEVGD